MQQSPQMETAERAAQTIPALSAAAAAVGLEDHRRMLQQHAHRVADTYALGRKALTNEPPTNNVDDMGDIVITGDIKITDPAQAAGVLDSLRGNDSAVLLPAPPVQQPSLPKFRWALPASIITAGALTAGGLTYLADTSPPSKTNSSDVDVGFGQPVTVKQ